MVRYLSQGNTSYFLSHTIDYGPGYRVYYKDIGGEIVILLCGGDKTTQEEDIAEAKRIAALPLEEEE